MTLMDGDRRQAGERALLRTGAVAAALGTVMQVAAGTGFGNRPSDGGAEAMLRWLSGRPDWYWPAVYLGFMLGAVLWVGAFVAIGWSLHQGWSWALGRLGLAGIVIGVAIHIVDGSLSGVALRTLAGDWAGASAEEQVAIVRDGATLLAVLEGTWASVITFFHGLPFVLMGLAVVLDRRYPAWIGWVGVVGGVLSLAAGLAMFATEGDVPDLYFIAGALVISLFMLAAGMQLWLLTTEEAARGGGPGEEVTEQRPRVETDEREPAGMRRAGR